MILMESGSREAITDAIDVLQISENTFLSKSLWTPYGHPSVYGGQIMTQAVYATSLYANQVLALHSFQCCFLHTTSNALPIKYRIYKLKEGRTFSSFIVKAFQNKRICMILMSSFQKPEPTHGPSVQWPMPVNVPLPDELELDMDYYLRQSTYAEGEMNRTLLGFAQDRARIPIILTVSVEQTSSAGYLTSIRWIKVVGAEGCGSSVRKCVLTYMSDFDFIGVAPKALKLKRLGYGPGTVEAISTLNHSMQFYCDDFDCSDWLLFVTSAPRTGCGRASVLGKFYTRDGVLIAVAMQEGVVRANGNDVDADRKLLSKL